MAEQTTDGSNPEFSQKYGFRLEIPREKTSRDRVTGSELVRGAWGGGRDGGRLYSFTTEVGGVAMSAEFELHLSTSFEVERKFLGRSVSYYRLGADERLEMVNRFATDYGHRFRIETLSLIGGDQSKSALREFRANLLVCIFYMHSSFTMNAPENCPLEEGVFPDILDFRPKQFPKSLWALVSAKDGILNVSDVSAYGAK